MSQTQSQTQTRQAEEPFGIVNPNAAGIDVGAEEVFVCVPSGRDPDGQGVRRFATYTPDLEALAQWLKRCGVGSAALESTGVYWIPVYEILSAHGIKVEVVNARHIQNVPGRKSDVQDCQWIQQLHSYGMLRGSFRPQDDIVVLRSYLRHRESLIEHRASHIHHMHKALTQMNVRLTEVVSDVVGVTGMAIMRAITAGERDPHTLLAFRHKTCKHSEADFVKALTANYRAEHVPALGRGFALKQSLALYDFYTAQIAECDAQIERQFSVIKPMPEVNDDLPPLDKSRKTNSHAKNAPSYDARGQMYRITGVDLTDIDGLHASTAQTILSEIGTDMSRWPTVKHFAAWLGLAPKNDITGGKVKRSRTLKVHSPANHAFRMAAQAVGRTKTALGAFFRRKRAQIGQAQAIVATAHKIARIVYHMLKHRVPFSTMSADDYDQLQQHRERRALERRAARLGFRLVQV